ncbi:MAG: hypothetical protein WCD20_03045 [Rhodomicrobium sp.]
MCQLRRAACGQLPLSCLPRVDSRHVGIFPAEHRHQLMLACASLSRPNGPDLPQTVAIALRQIGLSAPILKGIAEASSAVGHAERGLQPRVVAKRARIQDGAQGRQDRQRQDGRAPLVSFEHLEGDGFPVPALLLPADQHGVGPPHAEIEHDRHGETRPGAHRPIILEAFHVLFSPRVKSIRGAAQLLELLGRIRRGEIILDRPGKERRNLLHPVVSADGRRRLHVTQLPHMNFFHVPVRSRAQLLAPGTGYLANLV